MENSLVSWNGEFSGNWGSINHFNGINNAITAEVSKSG